MFEFLKYYRYVFIFVLKLVCKIVLWPLIKVPEFWLFTQESVIEVGMVGNPYNLPLFIFTIFPLYALNFIHPATHKSYFRKLPFQNSPFSESS